MTKSNKNLQLQKSRKKLWLLLLAISVPVLIVGFLVFTFLAYGGPRGFWLEIQPFPGVNSANITTQRNEAKAEVQAAVKRLTELPGVGQATVLPHQSQDMCEKGAHTLGIAGAPQDSIAYECSLETNVVLAYSEAECTVAEALLNNGIRFGSLAKNCPQESFQYNSGKAADLGQNSRVSLSNKDSYVQFFEPGVDSPSKCSAYAAREVLYCKPQHIDDNEVMNDIETIPAEAQTIVTISIINVYYSK